MVWTSGVDGRGRATNRSFARPCGGNEKQREAEEGLDGELQRRPEGEKHRLEQDWQSDQEQRSLEEP